LFIRRGFEKLVVADHQQPEPEPRMNVHKNARHDAHSQLSAIAVDGLQIAR
jgi:hypothetical protein